MAPSKCVHGRLVGKRDNGDGTFICLKCRGAEEERTRMAPVLKSYEDLATVAKRLVLALKACKPNFADVPKQNVDELLKSLEAIKSVVARDQNT